MSISLYEASIGAYLQTLGGVANVMNKGREYAASGEMNLEELVRYRLREDMAPFSFQVISVWHHSLGAIKGLQAGLFEPPPKMADMNFDKLDALIVQAREFLETQNEEAINAIAEEPMTFRVGEREIPFLKRNFILSFSLPNFYFHAATLYDILRIQGVPLGKMDYLGSLRVGG